MKINILQVLSHKIPSGDGIYVHVINLAKRLKERGHRVTLMTRGHWRKRVELEYDGFRVIRVPFYPCYPFHVYLHGYFIRKTIESLRAKPDLIHLHSPLVPYLPKKWPIVTTIHTPMLVDTAQIENVGLRSNLIKLMGRTTSYWVEKKLLDISDAVITVSQGVADELSTFYRYTNHLYPILNVVDTTFFKPSISNHREKKLLFVGRLAHRKGLFEIINSAEDVIKEYPNTKYIFVGSGPLENKLKENVDRRHLSANIEFCGEIRDSARVRQYYYDAYAVLIPSHYEGLPMTLLEAMACGKPIISTFASFSRGILEDGKNSVLVKPKSSQELARAILKLLSSGDLCKKLGQNARKTVIKKMNPTINTDRTEGVYTEAIKKWRRKRGK